MEGSNGQTAEAEKVVAEAYRGAGEEDTQSYPAVIVVKIPMDEPGKFRIDILEANGLDPMAVPTLLRAAAKIREAQLGVRD